MRLDGAMQIMPVGQRELRRTHNYSACRRIGLVLNRTGRGARRRGRRRGSQVRRRRRGHERVPGVHVAERDQQRMPGHHCQNGLT